jgi:hypothetical protein
MNVVVEFDGCSDYADCQLDRETAVASIAGSRRNRMGITQLFCAGKSLALGFGLLATAGMAGCQSDMNGQTMPSAYSTRNNVQYYPPGSENKLSKEAAAMAAYRRNAGLQPMDGQASPASYNKPACNCASCGQNNSAQMQ